MVVCSIWVGEGQELFFLGIALYALSGDALIYLEGTGHVPPEK